ncbi:hypothetical protein ACN3XK_73160 [Actinomadura welshii]
MNRTAARRITRAQVSALGILTATLVLASVDVAAAHSDTGKSPATAAGLAAVQAPTAAAPAGPPW